MSGPGDRRAEMNRIADFVVDRAGIVRGALALLTLAAVIGVARLAIDDVPRSFFRSEDEAFERLEAVFRDFGSDDGDCVVLVEADDVFVPRAIAEVRRLESELAGVPGVADVLSLCDLLLLDSGLPRPLLPGPEAPPEAFEEARRRGLAHPLARGRLVAEDASATLVVVRLEDDVQAISAIRPVVQAVQAKLEGIGPDVRARMTGIPPIRAIIFDSIEREQRIFSIVGAILGFVVGWIVFRRLGPILITSCASILAGFWALGCFGLTGQSVNILNASMPLLIMVIALADAVHLMIDILRSRHDGSNVHDAARDAVRHLGLPCALTSMTTAIGFGSLAISRVGVIRDFGIAFALAVGLSFVVILTTVPLLSVRFLRAGARRGFDSEPNRLHRVSERLIRAVVRNARRVAVAGVLVTLGLGAVALRLEPDNRLTEATPRNSDSVDVLRACERAFGGVLGASVLCTWPDGRAVDAATLEALTSVQEVLDDHPFFHGSLSVLDLLELFPEPRGAPGGVGAPGAADGSPLARMPALALLPRALVARTWRPDLSRALVSARVPDRSTAEAEAAYAEVEASLESIRARHPGLDFHLTGTDVVARRNVNVMIVDFALGLGLAALVIFGVLTFAFGSFRLGALSVLPNVFPLVLAASVLAAIGLELQMTSVIAFTVCLGLAVDDTIHFVARYRRELERCGDPPEAAVAAFLHVGRALLVTTAILLGGFAALGLSEIPTTRTFAGICSLGLVAALIGDLLFLPALLVTLAGRDRRGQRRKPGSSVPSSF